MLKIVSAGTAGEQRWILCGQLAGPWVTELRVSWERVRSASDIRKHVVDLRDVTFIDESGVRLLNQMKSEGAEFLASGIETRDVLDNLASADQQPVRRLLPHLRSELNQGKPGDLKEEAK